MDRPAAPTLDVLVPAGRAALPPDPAEVALTALYAEPRTPWLRANMISTLDGAATGPDQRSGSINGPADLRVFTTLRAWADVVLVGAGTARAEGYRAPVVRASLGAARVDAGRPAHPDLAVVTASGTLDDALLADAPWVFTVAGAPGLPRLREVLPAERLHVHDGTVDLPSVVGTLHTAGLVRVLAEGGPGLLGDLLAAGVVDELCLTLAPDVVGGPAPRVVHRGAWLPAMQGRLTTLLRADDVLLGRWALARV